MSDISTPIGDNPYIVSSSPRWSLEIQGSRLTLRDHRQRPPQSHRGKRQPIQSFSRAARLRMLRRIAEIDWHAAGSGLFLTLTYPDRLLPNVMSDRNKHRYLINRHIERIAGRKLASVWRCEWKPRLSGKYLGQLMPHIHMLYFGYTYYDLEEIRGLWEGVIHANERVEIDCKAVHVGKMAAMYVAKYCGKEEHAYTFNSVSYRNRCGRHCGWIRRKMIPMHELRVVLDLPDGIADWVRHMAAIVLPWYDLDIDAGVTLLGKNAEDIITELSKMGIDGMYTNGIIDNVNGGEGRADDAET